MKKIVLTALGASLLISSISSVWAEGKYYEPSKETIAAKQSESSAMRLKYYNEYKAKGYDMASLDAYLNSATTSDSEYWAAFKVIKDKKEIPERRAHVAKLQSMGLNVSGFSEAVILDGGKFWEMVKSVEASKKTEVKKEEYKKEEYKKPTEVKKEEYKKEEVKKVIETKKEEVKAKVEEKKVQITNSQTERLKSLMKTRISRLPVDTRDVTLARLETALKTSIESANKRGAKLLAARYEILLSVVQEELNNIDDEALINGLFQ